MLPVSRVIGHKEWAPGRKSDPTYDMNWRRAGVAGIVPRGSTAPQTPAPAPAPRVLEDEMYIKCEVNGPGKGVTVALLSGPIFVGLSVEEQKSAQAAIDKGVAAEQWVGVTTWNELDRRSHALCDSPRLVKAAPDTTATGS